VMASSDNVLRGGLTPKSVDVEQLLRTVSYADARPTVLCGHQIGPGVQAYETAAEEFVLDRAQLEADESLHADVEHGVECFITLEGSAVLVCAGHEIKLGKGAAALAPAGIAYELRAMASGALVFRSRIPVP